MDNQSEEIEMVWRVVEALDREVDSLEQELLPPEKEDTVSEWENSDSNCPIRMT